MLAGDGTQRVGVDVKPAEVVSPSILQGDESDETDDSLDSFEG